MKNWVYRHNGKVFIDLIPGVFFSSLVIDMITADRKTDPPVAQHIFWAGTEGVVAAVLLLGGGLSALQTAAIATGLPFALVLVLMIFSLNRALAQDHPALLTD